MQDSSVETKHLVHNTPLKTKILGRMKQSLVVVNIVQIYKLLMPSMLPKTVSKVDHYAFLSK